MLRGVCLMRPLEIDWLFSPHGGAASLAPKGFDAFRKHVSLEEGCDDRAVLHAYYERFKNEKTRDAAARAWASWEGAASSISRRSGVATFSTGNWSFAHAPEYEEYMANMASRRDRGAEPLEEPKAHSPPDATAAAGSSAVPVKGEQLEAAGPPVLDQGPQPRR